MMIIFKPVSLSIAASLVLSISPFAYAQTADPEKTDTETAVDVATQPAEDLNLKKHKIPDELQEIEEAPYSMEGISNCRSIQNAVKRLDKVLGDDLDVVEEDSAADKRRKTAGSLGKSLVGGLIPFRGLVREITGAAGQERRYNQAVYAGVVRRSFLKGIGKQRGCRFPASPKS
ncbi:hypothetical protein [Alterisphingorhabdus coralli]|uniref:Uncharacterized protein n=1 Tax=Alterisphingorhabdus coralli TaxID=3071408 RepID=A0AA97FB32_9SPHN|nr:hypothetical protein [Parasphingorhabdus sp. SCSIO 66989]WOE76508.1 hypothetical protein RB602_07280 [Parasphingorhabdus sp. SCSIO 66989]